MCENIDISRIGNDLASAYIEGYKDALKGCRRFEVCIDDDNVDILEWIHQHFMKDNYDKLFEIIITMREIEYDEETDEQIYVRNIRENVCLNCSHSMSAENNKLICVFNEDNHKQVKEYYTCQEFN